jgi:hypothetical protein
MLEWLKFHAARAVDAMAFKLDKEQSLQKQQWVSKLRDAEHAFEAARAACCETIGEASQWAGLIALGFQREFDSKSERWQSGKIGEAIFSWLDDWNAFEPERMEQPESVADALEGLPDQPERRQSTQH